MDYPYEASDEASESELLDKSLSMWRGWETLDEGLSFRPTLLDLHTAASIGLYDCVSAYIASGEVNINQRNHGGWTPLMYASYIGHDNVVNLLLEAGAEVDVRNEKGATALMLTASCGNESVAYFLVQQGAELRKKDHKGWTALFYATYAGHQKVIQFLLDCGENPNAREPCLGITPFMMAAAAGHVNIVNLLLEYGADMSLRNKNSETARSLARINGHMRIISLIDTHNASSSGLPREAELRPSTDLSSSDEAYHRPSRPHGRLGRSKPKGPSIRDGPETLARLLRERQGVGPGTEKSSRPYSPPDSPANSTNTDSAFCLSGGPTVKGNSCNGNRCQLRCSTSLSNSCQSSTDEQSSETTSFGLPHTSNSSSEGLTFVGGALSEQLSQKALVEYGCRGFGLPDAHLARSSPIRELTRETPNHGFPPLVTPPPQSITPTLDGFFNNSVGYHSSVPPIPSSLSRDITRNDPADMKHSYPFQDLGSLLDSLGLRKKYFRVFEEQDVDLRVFLTLTDSDLKEVGIKLMGPRRKMTNAIARWHSQARPFSDGLEQVYADRVETAMQEMAIHLQEALVKKSEFEGQVLQERELRSFMDGCRLEDRKRHEQLLGLVSESRKFFNNVKQLFDNVKSCQTELLSRLQNLPSFISKDVRLDNLPQQFGSQLQLDPNQRRPSPNESSFPPPQPDRNPLVSAITSSLVVRGRGEALSPGNQQTNAPSSGSHVIPGKDSEEVSSLTMQDLLSMLNHSSRQLEQAVAIVTNSLDQLLDSQMISPPN